MANLRNENIPTSAAGTQVSALTAFFDSRADAERALARLEDAGIPADSIRFLPGYEADDNAANVASDDRRGFWSMLGGWLFPDDDRAVYAEGLRRGGFLVSVQVDDASYETAHDILDDEGSIDMDERADQWRREGWTASHAREASAAPAHDRRAAAEDDLTVTEDAFAPDRTATERAMDSSTVSDEAAPVGKRDLSNGTPRVRSYTSGQSAADEPEVGVPKTAPHGSETIEGSARRMISEADGGQSQSQDADGQSQSQCFRRT
ncbi:hypothetical protein FHX15_002066 [Rhizobium sp. BK650]|uniref:hypothetical protein n=1 Tax=Rhizobium sp. BK650 TaxID=2586990 RepID=UPI00160CCBE2|nr:hypothetical protein [Rhizobium sp. BK650]MBB3656838.1 hypothetical protein [Rhizobium sp. BK650]